MRQTDAAGNTSASATSPYTLDTAAPAAPVIGSSPSSPGSTRTPSWSFAGDIDAVHECRLMRGATVVSDWAPCAASAAFDLAGEPDDDYTFYVRGRDQAGNTGPAASSDYHLDTVGAGATIESGPGPLGNSAKPAWSFSGEPAATFECRLERADALFADWAPCSSPRSYDLSTAPDGRYTFSVRARDPAGNVGDAASYVYKLDRAAPDAPRFTKSPGGLGNDTTPRWELTAELGAVVECRLTSDREGFAGRAMEPCAVAHTEDLRGQADGDYTLEARATDAAGNTGPAAQSTYRLDTTPPDAPEITAGPGAGGHDSSVSWAFTGEPGAEFECYFARGETVLSGWQSCTQRARYDLTGSSLGKHLFKVRARDRAGNLGPAASSEYELLAQTDPLPIAPLPPGVTASPRDPDPPRDPGHSRPPRDYFSPYRPKPSPRVSHGESAGSGDSFLANAATAASGVAQRTAFPALLSFLMLSFFAIQDRIDRREPKLALAPINDEPYLSFEPDTKETPDALSPIKR